VHAFPPPGWHSYPRTKVSQLLPLLIFIRNQRLVLETAPFIPASDG